MTYGQKSIKYKFQLEIVSRLYKLKKKLLREWENEKMRANLVVKHFDRKINQIYKEKKGGVIFSKTSSLGVVICIIISYYYSWYSTPCEKTYYLCIITLYNL